MVFFNISYFYPKNVNVNDSCWGASLPYSVSLFPSSLSALGSFSPLAIAGGLKVDVKSSSVASLGGNPAFSGCF